VQYVTSHCVVSSLSFLHCRQWFAPACELLRLFTGSFLYYSFFDAPTTLLQIYSIVAVMLLTAVSAAIMLFYWPIFRVPLAPEELATILPSPTPAFGSTTTKAIGSTPKETNQIARENGDAGKRSSELVRRTAKRA
jgi:hypothetical protein